MPSSRPVRRPSALVAALVLALLALVGCAADDPADDGTGGAAGEGLLPRAEGTTDYPLTVPTWAGESVIEERPARIAVLGFSTNLDVLQALDVTPVYALTEEVDYEWRDTAWAAGIETVDTATRRDPIPFEAVAAARPDLIITLNSLAQDTEFDTLSRIAPVLDYEDQPGDKADWRAGQRLVGDALDLRAAADEVVEEADRSIADVAEAHPELEGRTITIATDYAEGGMQYYNVAGGTAETFTTDLGFATNPRSREFVDDPTVAEESLSLLDADVLAVSYLDDATRQARERSRVFQLVPAVADDRYVAILADDPDAAPNVTWVLRRGASALSLPWAAEAFVDTWLDGVELPAR